MKTNKDVSFIQKVFLKAGVQAGHTYSDDLVSFDEREAI